MVDNMLKIKNTSNTSAKKYQNINEAFTEYNVKDFSSLTSKLEIPC